MNERTIALTKRLMDSEYALPKEILQSDFHISSRTLRNDIKEINDFLISKKISTIKNYRNEGYRLDVNSNEKKTLSNLVEILMQTVFIDRKNRIFDLILSFSLGTEKTVLYRKEKEYLISKSTMDEDMRRVRSELDKYKITVKSIPKKGMTLFGSEQAIRIMIYDLLSQQIENTMLEKKQQNLSQSHLILNKYIPFTMLEKLNELYDTSEISKESTLYRNQVIIFTAIWIIRCGNLEILDFPIYESRYKEEETIKEFVAFICQSFHLNPPKSEETYILFMLNTFYLGDVSHSIEWIKAQFFSIELIQFVEAKTKIPFFHEEESLYEGLYKHIIGLIRRIENQVNIINPLTEHIKKNYRTIYASVKEFMNRNNFFFKQTISEDELAFLTIHFSTAISVINQDLHYIYKAVVVCNHGITTGKLLSENLKELFNLEIVSVLSSREINRIDEMDVDLIFSTVPIPYKKKPILIVSPLVNINDKKKISLFLKKYQNSRRTITIKHSGTSMFYQLIEIIKQSGGNINAEIYGKLETLFEKNNLKIDKKEIQPMLKDILTDNHILLKEKTNDWEEAIRKVAKPLSTEGIITEEYTHAMIDSVKEYGSYIVIGKNFALAHARPENGVNKLGISVATLDPPISFGNEDNDPVKIVFCLAATDSYSHLNIMKELIELINDEEKLNDLSKQNSIAMFKEILFK